MSVDQQTARLCDELRTWQEDCRPLYELWGEMWRKWRIVPKEEPAPGTNSFRSKIRVPYTHFHVEVVVPRLVGSEIEFDYKAVDAQRDAPVAQLHSGITRFQGELMDLKLGVKRFVRQGCITGYTVAKDGWVKSHADETSVERVHHYDEELRTSFRVAQERTDRRVTVNQPFFEPVNVLDFVWPIWAPTLNRAPAVWQRSWVTMQHLRDYEALGIYHGVDQVKPDGIRELQQSRQNQWDQQQLSPSLASYDDETSDPGLQIVELWERWTDDRLQVIASPKGNPVMLRDDPNPYHHGQKPFVDWSPVPEVFQLQGIGLVAALYDLNEDLNTLRRQRTDGVTYAVNPAWKGRGFQGNQLVIFPGRYVPVDEMSDIEPLFMPDVDWGSLERLEEGIKLDMQNMTGASASLSGDQSSAGQAASTATGVSTLTTESNKRIDEMRDELSQRALKRLGFHLAANNAQFLDADFAANFSDDPRAMQAWQQMAEAEEAPWHGVVEITPDMIRLAGRMLCVPKVGSDSDSEKQKDMLDATQLVQMMGPALALMPPPISLKQFFDYVLEKAGVPPDRRREILDNQAEMAQFMAQQQAAAAQAAPPGQGQPPPSGGDNASTGAVGGLAGVAA